MTDYLGIAAMFILYLAAPAFLYIIRDKVIARYKSGAQARCVAYGALFAFFAANVLALYNFLESDQRIAFAILRFVVLLALPFLGAGVGSFIYYVYRSPVSDTSGGEIRGMSVVQKILVTLIVLTAASYGMIVWHRQSDERGYLLLEISRLQKEFEQPSSMIANDVGRPLVVRLDPERKSVVHREAETIKMQLHTLVDGPRGHGQYLLKQKGRYAAMHIPGDPDNLSLWTFDGFEVTRVAGSVSPDWDTPQAKEFATKAAELQAELRRLTADNNAPGIISRYEEALKTPLRYYLVPNHVGDSLAWAYESLGQRSNAAHWYGRLAQSAVWNNWEEANRLIAKAQALDPAEPEVAIALKFLERQRGMPRADSRWALKQIAEHERKAEAASIK